MKFNFKKQISTLALATSFAATASLSLAGECRVAEARSITPVLVRRSNDFVNLAKMLEAKAYLLW